MEDAGLPKYSSIEDTRVDLAVLKEKMSTLEQFQRDKILESIVDINNKIEKIQEDVSFICFAFSVLVIIISATVLFGTQNPV